MYIILKFKFTIFTIKEISDMILCFTYYRVHLIASLQLLYLNSVCRIVWDLCGKTKVEDPRFVSDEHHRTNTCNILWRHNKVVDRSQACSFSHPSKKAETVIRYHIDCVRAYVRPPRNVTGNKRLSLEAPTETMLTRGKFAYTRSANSSTSLTRIFKVKYSQIHCFCNDSMTAWFRKTFYRTHCTSTRVTLTKQPVSLTINSKVKLPEFYRFAISPERIERKHAFTDERFEVVELQPNHRCSSTFYFEVKRLTLHYFAVTLKRLDLEP